MHTLNNNNSNRLLMYILLQCHPSSILVANKSVGVRTKPSFQALVYHGTGVFFFGRTFDLVSGRQCICACAVPHPLCMFVKGVLNMIEQNDCQEDCSWKDSDSSGDF